MSEMNGPWRDLEKDLNGFGLKLTSRLQLATLQNAELVRKVLVKHLQNQDLSWKPLSPAYLASKKRRHLSTATLIATSQLMQSITTELAGDRLSAFVGVLRSGKRKDGEPPVLIAEIHEFGSHARNITARPLFRPTFKEVQPDIENGYKKAVREVLENTGH